MTTVSKPYPTRVKIRHNKTDGWVVLDQIRTIDRKRITRSYNRLTSKEISKVKAVIFEAYVA